jgi:hypothetical protein
MSWRETWRATVESFLREVRDPEEPAAPDPVVAAIAAARAELVALERDHAAAESRVAAETEAAAVCARRREQSQRIGDSDTARIAGTFERRHAMRAAVLRRKCVVLQEELALARATLDDLLDYARVDASGLNARPPQGER